MKKRILIILLAVCTAFSPVAAFAEGDTALNQNNGVSFKYTAEGQTAVSGAPEIACKAALLADPVSGKVFYEKNAHEKMYPASTTKILTALVVLENCDLNETVTVSQNAIDLVPWDGSSAYLKAGEKFSVYVLLQALLIRSANEAANALAEYVSGSVDAFVELCNARAAELGCENLHFVNTNGLHDDNHYCTAYDLFLIARECKKHEVFNEIVSSTGFTVPGTDIYPNSDRYFKNTNKLILPQAKNYYYPYCTGIKTGNTTPAGRCLVASCSKDGMDLICVVMGGEINSEGLSERYLDTIALFDYAYNNYSYQVIAEKNAPQGTVHIKKATRKTAELQTLTGAEVEGILPNGFDINSVKATVITDEKLRAPIEQNQVIGTVTFSADGVDYTTKLLAASAVEKPPFAIQNFVVLIIILLLCAAVYVIIMRTANKRRQLITE